MKHESLSYIQEAVKKHEKEAAVLSDHLAANPEVAYEEFKSSRAMADLLKQAGFQVTYPFAGYDTAFCGVLDNGDGPSVAILTEYDALPGIGHGCGHNLHGSLSILTGLTLMELKEHFRGKVYVVGTPAEEASGAKITMASDGIFDEMDLAVMMHSGPGGVCMPNTDSMSLRGCIIEFFGQTAHAAACPWQGRSALAAARKFLDLVDARRECFTPDIRVNAVILDGGLVPNVIPDYAKVKMEFRTSSMRRLEDVDDIIRKCARGAAIALDCEVKLDFPYPDYADVVRDTPLENEISELLSELGFKVEPVGPATGSSDVGNVSYRCPTIQPQLAITDENCALHTTEFCAATQTPAAHKAMVKGAAAMTALILRVFNDETFRRDVRRSFEEELRGK